MIYWESSILLGSKFLNSRLFPFASQLDCHSLVSLQIQLIQYRLAIKRLKNPTHIKNWWVEASFINLCAAISNCQVNQQGGLGVPIKLGCRVSQEIRNVCHWLPWTLDPRTHMYVNTRRLLHYPHPPPPKGTATMQSKTQMQGQQLHFLIVVRGSEGQWGLWGEE